MLTIAAITLITNLAFQVGWNDETHCPAWVSWDIEPREVVKAERAHIPFASDPRAAGSDLAADYAGSGFDRGHMAPAADFNFDRAALAETYLFSNICPQVPHLNRGKWAAFESETRKLAQSGTVHVVCWPVFDFKHTNKIGRVYIPIAFEKVAWGWFGVRHIRAVNFATGWSCGDVKNKKGTKK